MIFAVLVAIIAELIKPAERPLDYGFTILVATFLGLLAGGLIGVAYPVLAITVPLGTAILMHFGGAIGGLLMVKFVRWLYEYV